MAQAIRRTAAAPAEDLRETANSYFGLLSQASHSQKDRGALARLILKRGHTVNGALTKTYPMRCPMNAPTFCRTSGKRIGDCHCLRCNPPKEPPCNAP